MKILLADDDPVSCRLTAAALRRAGHEVVAVQDGKQAWEALTKGKHDIAVLDWMMPEMDGVTLCRRFRRQVAADPLYIVLLTAKAEQEDIVKGLNAGADDYLVKPFDPEELQARVRAAARIIQLERQLLEANARLAALASTDDLTKLMNRRAILNRLVEEAAKSLQTHQPLSIIMMDVDGFKQINDHHGHGVGDTILKEFCHRVTASLRSDDSLGRIGGDEFLVLLPGAGEQEAVAVGERMRAKIASEPFYSEAGICLPITASLGFTEVDPTARVETILSLADRAMYEAKRGGNEGRAASSLRKMHR